jgi:hypothetical protein
MEEAREQGIPVLNATPRIHCKVFEDNAGAIEMQTYPRWDQEPNISTSSTITLERKWRRGLSAYTTQELKSRLQIFLPSPYLNSLS